MYTHVGGYKIMLSRPHPDPSLKRYQIKEVVDAIDAVMED